MTSSLAQHVYVNTPPFIFVTHVRRLIHRLAFPLVRHSYSCHTCAHIHTWDTHFRHPPCSRLQENFIFNLQSVFCIPRPSQERFQQFSAIYYCTRVHNKNCATTTPFWIHWDNSTTTINFIRSTNFWCHKLQQNIFCAAFDKVRKKIQTKYREW